MLIVYDLERTYETKKKIIITHNFMAHNFMGNILVYLLIYQIYSFFYKCFYLYTCIYIYIYILTLGGAKMK